MDKKVIKITADGSHTLYVPELDETYHSTHGAIQEALHVFIDAGLHYFKDKKEIHILEIGFGTALNTFLTLKESLKTKQIINYDAIEAFPLERTQVNALNYMEILNASDEELIWYNQLHQVDWEENMCIIPSFLLHKMKMDFTKDVVEEKKYDLIYFDAFGPRVQPEMWTMTVFKKIYHLLSKGGIVVTYCAKGSVKRTMKEVGFQVESLPGPPGKREMTRAIK